MAFLTTNVTIGGARARASTQHREESGKRAQNERHLLKNQSQMTGNINDGVSKLLQREG
jgi:hypothetical protein